MLRFKWETRFKSTEIGEIPQDWNESILADVVNIDQSPSRSSNLGNVRFISMEDISADCYSPSSRAVDVKDIKSGKEVLSGSILVAKITPSFEHGKMCIVPDTVDQKWFATTEVFSLKPKGNNDVRFIYYLLKHPNLRNILENSMSGTSGRQRVQSSAVKNLQICYPLYPEQSRCATVLSWFDELIENKKRQNEVLDTMMMAIFKSWFIDFKPFRGSDFVDSLLGKIPKEWEVKPLEEIVILSKGLSYSSSEISSEPQGDLFVTLNNFNRDGGFKTEYVHYIGSKAKEEHKVKEGDLIIALTDMTPEARVVGAPAIVVLPSGYGYGIISLDCGRLEPVKECSRLYLYLYLRHSQEENSTYANGVNVLHLNTKLFMQNKLVVMPSQTVVERFDSLIAPLSYKLIVNQKQILVLKKIRNALLPSLVFGRLRVEEI